MTAEEREQITTLLKMLTTLIQTVDQLTDVNLDLLRRVKLLEELELEDRIRLLEARVQP